MDSTDEHPIPRDKRSDGQKKLDESQPSYTHDGRKVIVIRPWNRHDMRFNDTDKKVLVRDVVTGKEQIVFVSQVDGYDPEKVREEQART